MSEKPRTDPFTRGQQDCLQDYCENAAFASVGGIENRLSMKRPKWILEEEERAYLAGYRDAAQEAFGDDWATCEFGWAPAMTLGESKGGEGVMAPRVSKPLATPVERVAWMASDTLGRLPPGTYVCRWWSHAVVLCQRQAGAWWFDGDPCSEVSCVMCVDGRPLIVPDADRGRTW